MTEVIICSQKMFCAGPFSWAFGRPILWWCRGDFCTSRFLPLYDLERLCVDFYRFVKGIFGFFMVWSVLWLFRSMATKDMVLVTSTTNWLVLKVIFLPILGTLQVVVESPLQTSNWAVEKKTLGLCRVQNRMKSYPLTWWFFKKSYGSLLNNQFFYVFFMDFVGTPGFFFMARKGLHEEFPEISRSEYNNVFSRGTLTQMLNVWCMKINIWVGSLGENVGQYTVNTLSVWVRSSLVDLEVVFFSKQKYTTNASKGCFWLLQVKLHICFLTFLTPFNLGGNDPSGLKFSNWVGSTTN